MKYYDESILTKNATKSLSVLTELNNSIENFYKAVHKYENNTLDYMNEYYKSQVEVAFAEYSTIRRVGFLAGVFTIDFFSSTSVNTIFNDYLRITVWNNKKRIID